VVDRQVASCRQQVVVVVGLPLVRRQQVVPLPFVRLRRAEGEATFEELSLRL
jgi:hypothetical protein